MIRIKLKDALALCNHVYIADPCDNECEIPLRQNTVSDLDESVTALQFYKSDSQFSRSCELYCDLDQEIEIGEDSGVLIKSTTRVIVFEGGNLYQELYIYFKHQNTISFAEGLERANLLDEIIHLVEAPALTGKEASDKQAALTERFQKLI